MRKSLLLLAAVAFAGVANAQVIVGLATDEELATAGLAKDKAQMDPVTIVDNEAGAFGTAYADKWGSTTTYKNYRNVTVNGTPVQLGSGAVGDANPTFTSFEAGAPSAGAVFKITAKQDGYMTVFTKVNPNKQYLVYEGTVDGAIVYALGWSNGEQKIYYAMPSDEYGMIDFNSPEASKYLIPATKQSKNEAGELLWLDQNGNVVAGERPVWTGEDGKEKKGSAVMEEILGQTKPAMPWNAAGLEKAPGESTGFLSFHVWADMDYYFCALGSKAACGGFIFTEEVPSIVYDEVLGEDGSVTYAKVEFPAILEGAGVEGVEAVADENAPVYNMLGVRVNADAKGILIQNGKKFIRK